MIERVLKITVTYQYVNIHDEKYAYPVGEEHSATMTIGNQGIEFKEARRIAREEAAREIELEMGLIDDG